MLNSSRHLEDFRSGLSTCNLPKIRQSWKSMTDDQKKLIRKEISTLPKDIGRDIHLRLSLIDKDLAVEVLGQEALPVTISLDGRRFTAEEMRDTCLTNIKALPRLVIALYALNDIERKSFLNDLKKIDVRFFNSIMISLDRLEDHGNKVMQDKRVADRVVELSERTLPKTPITFLCEYVEDKVEVLRLYKEKLLNMGLTEEQVAPILEIESYLLGPEVFQNARNTKNTT